MEIIPQCTTETIYVYGHSDPANAVTVYAPRDNSAAVDAMMGMVSQALAFITIDLDDLTLANYGRNYYRGSGSGNSSFLDDVQSGLDYIGLAPGWGEWADGLNAVIYLARGDYTNAGLSGSATIPFVGWGATVTKMGVKAADAANGGIKQIFKSIHDSGNVPANWVRASQQKVKIKNQDLLRELRKMAPGEWKKVYDIGRDGTQIHYFQHSSGKVFDVKIK